MAASPKMLINGALVGGGGTSDVINPSTGRPFARAPDCTRAQLEEAIQAARDAFPAWSSLPIGERQEMLMQGAGKVKSKAAEIAKVLTQEQGKPIGMATGEMYAVAYFLDEFGKKQFEFEKVLSESGREKVVQKLVPLGVVAGITPWNYPPLMAAWKICEALVTGNTCVLKPSPYTPLSTLMLGEALAGCFPPGVLNVISGGDDLGRWLVDHPGVDKISFTGSTATGKRIHTAASGTLKRLQLELGGNDAAVILADADPKAAARGVFEQAMGNTGQVCTAVKRLYVHESKFAEVVGHLVEMAKAARVGDGFEDGVQYGPLNNKMQYDRVRQLVDDARAGGAEVRAGGAPLDREGYFYPPTVLTSVAEGMRIVDEEQFGPVLPVMPFSDVEEVIARANGTRYGLGGSVWGSDVEKATEVASRLECGTAWVNCHGPMSPDVPFGGSKESGLGRQMGEGTIASFTEPRILRIAKPAQSKL